MADLIARLLEPRELRRRKDGHEQLGPLPNRDGKEAAERIKALEAAITYAAETTNDKHTARKLFEALSPSPLQSASNPVSANVTAQQEQISIHPKRDRP